ncbi:MAG: hypothetical protein WC678_02240 [Parcubacteria group bacterium]|jgi:hypothetical protein
MKFTKTKIIFLLLLLVNLIPVFCLAATATTGKYIPMEEIPGFGRPADFPAYLMAIYKFGLWAIGTSAMFMIMIGGYMYLTSAGNNSQTGKAKGIITDAIAGIILALVSYVLLWTINPELVQFKPLVGIAPTSTSGTTTSTVKATMPANCNSSEWQTLFQQVSSSTGIDKCILQALVAKESSCNQVPARTNGGRDCSAVQIAANANCGTTCEDLESNPKKALECAARYLKQCSSKWRTNNEEQKIRDIYAGYNGGCVALNPSRDCSGSNTYGSSYLQWDCTINCNLLCPVPERTNVFLNFYNQCKGS